jgi:hypothetical protein
MMNKPRTVWVLQKHKTGTKGWEICWSIWSITSTEVEGKARAKRFTEESRGWRFRVSPFLLVPLKEDV